MTIESDSKRRKVYVYPNHPRSISIFSISGRHPLNVKPSGNSLLNNDTTLNDSKNSLLGVFASFPDELIQEVIGYIDDSPSLRNLSHVSRIFYAFLYDEEIWKKLYVKNITLYNEREWLGSWRNTVLGIKHSADIQLMDNLVCSDVLYRPFQCSQINYSKLFAKILVEEETYHNDSILGQLGKLPQGRILRINENDLSISEFNTNYHDTPFILTNSDTTRWPQWTFAQLNDQYSDVKFRQEAVEWDLGKFNQYLHNNKDENPLYLFDCNSIAMQTLRKQYVPPQIFQQDLFSVFNKPNQFTCRPDHAWLIMGSARSGSTFHKDPNYTCAWNVAITGRKLWIMLPPHITPPGVSTDDEESEVTSPVGIAEWVLSGFFNDSIKIAECVVGVTFPGECMYVPSGWWHSVINIDDSIAITQNFVPISKLANALDFLKNKQGQVSGFRPREINVTLHNLLTGGAKESSFQNYVDVFDSLNIDVNEDCGEIADLPGMPIYELFVYLLKQNGMEMQLKEALVKLEKIELKAYEKETGKSKAWEKLTEPSSTAAFSFGFEDSSDEE
ncbi:F-box protein [Spathaspora sp. JA1]|nr:F-box protein [Spathaspora sp. JA1]